jgi:hypothetical protein
VNSSAKIAFDDAGEPVLAAEFDYAAVDGIELGAEASSHAQDALAAVQHGLLIVIRDGHADGALVRAGALARLCNLFATDAEAAAEVRVNRSTMTRAVRRLKSEIVCAAQRKKSAIEPMKSIVSCSPN